MREESQLKRIQSLIEGFNFKNPFSVYLNEHFRENRQMGARDRRLTRDLCYTYFRIGRTLTELPFRERLTIACFLCNNASDEMLKYLLTGRRSFEKMSGESLESRIEFIGDTYPSFNFNMIFPMYTHLSDAIPIHEWILSFLKRPRVWIRIRKKHLDDVMKELNALDIKFQEADDPLCLSFDANVHLTKTKSYESGYFEIQDVNSQKTSSYFDATDGEKWWDACAGSGGKSLMLAEMADVHILATDVRPAILRSFSARLRKAGFENFDTMEMNFHPEEKRRFNLPAFDGVIADVPCTGSGTWSRSPEWNQTDLSEKIKNHFIPIQRSAVARVAENLKRGRHLIYITCSVFKEENEENIRFFESNFTLKTEKFEYLKGFSMSADTLFVARFIKE